MNWVEWLKGFAERRPEAEGTAQKRGPIRPQPTRNGGKSYAKEWVKVLEDTAPGRDPNNTYTWELTAEDTAKLRAAQPEKKAVPKPTNDPDDTYTWELQEGDSPDDPWGLNKTAPPQRATRKEGVNPYDTGAFDATWTGRFDQR